MDRDEIKTLVASLIERLGARVDGISISQGPRVVIAVTSPDPGLLIGANAEHLQALNTLARRLCEKRGGEVPSFLIDVNGHHESRLETLRENAKLLAQRARLFKHDVEMAPMSSYERLVIHELFAEDQEIRTESQGEGKSRRIVLKYKTGSELSSSDLKPLSSGFN